MIMRMIYLFQVRRFEKKIIAVGLAVSLSSCAAVEFMRCASHGEDVPFDAQKNNLELCRNTEGGEFKAQSIIHPVYCFPSNRSKPPVLLLHELPGLSGKTLAYAKELSQDFTVYVPLLFGELNMYSTLWGSAAFWFNGQWWGLESGDSKIVASLRAVVKEIERLHENQPIGVIGNCLTGSIPLALLDNRQIHAVVLAQPTLPLTIFDNSEDVRKSLGISRGEITKAQDSSAKILYLRFQTDCISKPEKQETLRTEFPAKRFPGRVTMKEIPGSASPDERVHSTLIGEWSDAEPGKPSRDSREEVKRFLRDPEQFVSTSKQ